MIDFMEAYFKQSYLQVSFSYKIGLVVSESKELECPSRPPSLIISVSTYQELKKVQGLGATIATLCPGVQCLDDVKIVTPCP